MRPLQIVPIRPKTTKRSRERGCAAVYFVPVFHLHAFSRTQQAEYNLNLKNFNKFTKTTYASINRGHRD